MIRLPLKRALMASAALRTTTTTMRAARSASAVVPRVARPAFWKSIVPTFLRPSEKGHARKRKRSKEWNPATFFIVIFLFIGSMSVEMISLRKDFEAFMRRADVKISSLREVVEKLQRGEEVDVEKELGAGDKEREQAWHNVLKELELDDAVRQHKKKQPAAPQPPIEEVKTVTVPEKLAGQPEASAEQEEEFF